MVAQFDLSFVVDMGKKQLSHELKSLQLEVYVCGTDSPMLSGLKTRSLGLNTLGTTYSPALSQSVQVGHPSTPSWVQPVLSKVNVTCSRPQRNVHRPGLKPGNPWSEIRRPNH